MVNTRALHGLIVAKGETQRSMAKRIGISEASFYSKMKRGVFNSDEMYALVKELNIEDPSSIFFADIVA